MSFPTAKDQLFKWWRGALEDVSLHLEVEAHPDEPQCGYFEMRLVKGGPMVPAKIWMVQITDPETGELLADEQLQCEIDGEHRDASEAWSWLCGRPITEARFNYLTATRKWAQKHAPGEPYADPRKPVDWLNGVPTPNFSTKEAKT